MKTIKIQEIYFGLIFFILVQFSSLEIHFLTYLVTGILFLSKVSKKFLNIVSFLLLITIIASLPSLFNFPTFYDFIKDFTYFTKPILAITAGFLICKKIGNLISFLRIITFITLFFSIWHILNILINIDFSVSSVSEIRKIGGLSNSMEVFVLIILLASFKYKFLNVTKNKLLKNSILFIISISFFLYFSRTMFVSFLIMLLAIYGYLKITRKAIKYGALTFFAICLFYGYLFSIDIDRGKPGIESFLYKMKIAPSEIFTPVRKIDKNNHAYLWDHWRAYEATKAIEQINTVPEFIGGKGLGALVDLEMSVYLGEGKMRYIPTLHNGFVNIFFKSGIIGLIIFLVFLLYVYLTSYNRTKFEKNRVVNNLIGGLAVNFIFTTLIVSGLYNAIELNGFILGGLLFFSYLKNKKTSESQFEVIQNN